MKTKIEKKPSAEKPSKSTRKTPTKKTAEPKATVAELRKEIETLKSVNLDVSNKYGETLSQCLNLKNASMQTLQVLLSALLQLGYGPNEVFAQYRAMGLVG